MRWTLLVPNQVEKYIILIKIKTGKIYIIGKYETNVEMAKVTPISMMDRVVVVQSEQPIKILGVMGCPNFSPLQATLEFKAEGTLR